MEKFKFVDSFVKLRKKGKLFIHRISELLVKREKCILPTCTDGIEERGAIGNF